MDKYFSSSHNSPPQIPKNDDSSRLSLKTDQSDKPLSDDGSLGVHDAVKLPHRRAFARQIAELGPSSVVDLGSGTGHQAIHLDKELPPETKLILVDCDKNSIEIARARTKDFNREVEVVHLDLDANPSKIPHGDVTLMFNFLPYLQHPDRLLTTLLNRRNRSLQVIRTWDEGFSRFGPMNESLRGNIQQSLRSTLRANDQCDYFSADRLLYLLHSLPYSRLDWDFDLITHKSPFNTASREYVAKNLDWTYNRCSEATQAGISEWVEGRQPFGNRRGSYFLTLDLVAFGS